MSVLRGLARDLWSANGWHAWVELLVRGVPGEFGIALRRFAIGRRFKKKGDGLAIHPGVRILGPSKMEVGRNFRVGLDCLIQANGGVEIGDDVIFGPGVKVWSVNHVFERTDVPIFDQGYEHKPVVIGDGAWLGANSFIMPGANIGAHVVVAAGSIVAGHDFAPYSILAGNPARRIGSRLDRTPVAAGTHS